MDQHYGIMRARCYPVVRDRPRGPRYLAPECDSPGHFSLLPALYFSYIYFFCFMFCVNIFRCADDARVDYDSLLDSEQRRSRFSEQLLDMELRESVRLGKMYRQLQRQINCRFSENRDSY